MTTPVFVILLVLGLGGAIVAQFLLDRLADATDAWHWLQHGLIFFGGMAAGLGLLGLYGGARSRL